MGEKCSTGPVKDLEGIYGIKGAWVGRKIQVSQGG
jgi:hypothetical protein